MGFSFSNTVLGTFGTNTKSALNMGIVYLFTITTAIGAGTVPFYLLTQVEVASTITGVAMKAVRIN
jgi:hypothetical protein